MTAISAFDETLASAIDLVDKFSKLERRLKRERTARLEAEGVAEQGLRDLYISKQRLALLEKIAAVANESDCSLHAIERALAEVCEFTGWACAHAYVSGAQSGTLASAGKVWADNHADLAPFLEASLSTQFDAGRGLPGRVLAVGLPQWIRDLSQDDGFIRRDVAIACGLRSAFAFPVLVANRCEAVLEFFSREHAEPDPELLELMRQLGTQLGRVIERERMAQRLAHEAHHDALTGLLNRTAFARALDRGFARMRADASRRLALVLLDIDDFRLINDMVGHATADRLLANMPDAIRRATDHLLSANGEVTLARLGADEFAILVEGVAIDADPARIGRAIGSGVKGLSPSGWVFEASICAGIVLASKAHGSGEEMVRDASVALREAKGRGRGQVVVFDAVLRNQSKRRMVLERDLRSAIASGDLTIGYQPIVTLSDGRVTGVEALARWTRAHDAISPTEFIPIAEESGLIVPLGDWVLLEACRTIAQANRHRQVPLSVSVNVSPQQFLQPDFGSGVLAALRETQLPATLLRLEITEGVAMQDIARTRAVLGDLCAAQVRVSLDDFGTGFSSLSYLNRLPVDTLKIDRAFIDQLAAGSEGQAIVRAILDLGRALSMDVIAEGVELEQQAQFLKEHGCSHAQGYLFGKAAQAEHVASFGSLPDRTGEVA